jgi:hypothetical protein
MDRSLIVVSLVLIVVGIIIYAPAYSTFYANRLMFTLPNGVSLPQGKFSLWYHKHLGLLIGIGFFTILLGIVGIAIWLCSIAHSFH